MTGSPSAPSRPKPETCRFAPEIMEFITDGFAHLDPETRILCFNRAAETLLGRRREDVLGRRVTDAFPEAKGSLFEEKFAQALRDRQPLSFETYFRRSPYENWYQVRVFPSGDGLSVFFRVTTEQRAAETALRESEETFSRIFDSSPAGMVISTLAEGSIIAFNPSFQQITGYSLEEHKGKTSIEAGFWVRAEDRQKATDMLRQSGSFSNREFPFRNKSGEVRLGLISASTATIQGRPCIVTALQDITEIRRAEKVRAALEERLQRARRMESLGLLAGGVAHDLNNILSGLVTVPQMILMEDGLPEDVREAVDTIREAGERAAAVVDDLLTVSRGAASRKETVDVNELVGKYLASLEGMHLAASYPDVEIVRDLDPQLFRIQACPAHIRKSVVNLIMNACEAIQGPGRVVVSTRNDVVTTPRKACEIIPAGDYAVLRVSDSGMGISREDMDKIFEPFYTRKVLGRSGTGLGLTVVWNTVKDHGGAIDVESGRDGTTFTLFLPALRHWSEPLPKRDSLQDLRGRGETVLVVDDDLLQREITCGLLIRLGYRARAVSSGEEAVDTLRGNPVDLVVLDMIMDTGIGGRETYQRILRHTPGQRAVLTSGYSETEDVKEAQRLGAGAFVKKPVTLESIGKAIRETLDG